MGYGDGGNENDKGNGSDAEVAGDQAGGSDVMALEATGTPTNFGEG
jgi:hypothetical protein